MTRLRLLLVGVSVLAAGYFVLWRGQPVVLRDPATRGEEDGRAKEFPAKSGGGVSQESPAEPHPEGVQGSRERGTRPVLLLGVRDEAGEAIDGASVIVEDIVSRRTVASVRSDERGCAALRSVAVGEQYRLSVYPSRRRPEVRGLVVPAWSAAETNIILHRGWVLEGSVVDSEGRGVPGCLVQFSASHGRWLGVVSGPKGGFSLGPLPSGPALIRVVYGGKVGDSVEIAERERARLLVGARAPSLTFHIHSWRELGLDVRAILSRPEFGRPDRETVIGEGGDAVFEGIDRDEKYTLWVGSGKGEYCVYVKGIRGSQGEVFVQPTRGLCVRGEVVGLSESWHASVSVRGAGFSCRGEMGDDGRFAIRGIPHTDELTVDIVAMGPGGRCLRQEKVARPGESVRFDLSRR